MTFSSSDFKWHLGQQLDRIARACRAYDAGEEGAAIDIGTALRVTFHDARRSVSLLTHLDGWRTPILTVVPQVRHHPHEPPGFKPVFERTFGNLVVGPDGSRFVADLRVPDQPDYLSAHDWWNQIVWRVSPEVTLTRATVVLGAVDQDGGAHVDKALDPIYAALRKSVGGLDPIPELPRDQLHTHFASLRQFGFELLESPQIRILATSR